MLWVPIMCSALCNDGLKGGASQPPKPRFYIRGEEQTRHPQPMQPRVRLLEPLPGGFLAGHMALLWTGAPHVTYEKTDVERDYDLVAAAGAAARAAVLPGQVGRMHAAGLKCSRSCPSMLVHVIIRHRSN